MTPTPSRSVNKPLIAALFLLFLAPVVGSRLWFSKPPEAAGGTFVAHVATNLAHYSFKPVPIDENAMETLATTNIVNGDFRKGTTRITAFAADWMSKQAQQMSVVQHTPDVCWIQTGFKAVDMGQPGMVRLQFGTNQIGFECRVMVPPGGRPELTLWCTLLNGRPIEEGFRFSNADLMKETGGQTKLSSRIRGFNMLLGALRTRTRADGTKQFLRLSTSVERSWKDSLAELQDFATEWVRFEPASAPRG